MDLTLQDLTRTYDPRDTASVLRTLAAYERAGISYSELPAPKRGVLPYKAEALDYGLERVGPVYYGFRQRAWSAEALLRRAALYCRGGTCVWISGAWMRYCGYQDPERLKRAGAALRVYFQHQIALIAESIKLHGQLNPVEINSDLRYWDGELRIQGCKMLGEKVFTRLLCGHTLRRPECRLLRTR